VWAGFTMSEVVKTTDGENADYSLRILWSIARWIEDNKGREALEADES